MTFHKHLLTAWIYCNSLLPMPWLYIKSYIAAWLIRNVVRYRRQVVQDNLLNAFPDKNEKERKTIERKFYRNLSDLLFEIIKSRTIHRKQITKRVAFENEALLDELYQKKKSIIMVIGHCGNWEWMTTVLEMKSPYRVFAVVKPMKDPFFENYLAKIRTRFNATGGLIPFKMTLKKMIQLKDELTITIIAGDQTPVKKDIQYRTTFLNQETPVYLGVEKIARKLNHAVVFCNVQRIKRGYYKAQFIMLEEAPQLTGDFEITGQHVAMLDKVIKENPDNWLWSHRRWKHKKISSDEA